MKRAPVPVRHPCHIRYHRMDMALRVERPTRVMLKQSIDQISRPHRYSAAIDLLTTFGKIGLHPTHRRFNRAHMGLGYACIAADEREQCGRFGHRECEVHPHRALAGFTNL